MKISAKIVRCYLLSYKIFEAGWSPALNNIVHSHFLIMACRSICPEIVAVKIIVVFFYTDEKKRE